MPNLENLKKQAKLILRWHRERHYPVAAQIRGLMPRFLNVPDSEILAAKSGHGDGLLMTRQLISTFRQPPLHYLTRSVRRTSGFVLADHTSRNRGCARYRNFQEPRLLPVRPY